MALKYYTYLFVLLVPAAYMAALGNHLIALVAIAVSAFGGLVAMILASLQKEERVSSFHLLVGGIAIGMIFAIEFVYFLPLS